MRFGIRNELGQQSCIFNLIVKKNDEVYLLERRSGDHIKVSLHRTGQNQISFTSTFISTLNIPNQARHITKWVCPKESPAFVISIPASELCECSIINKPIEWILAPSKESLTDIFLIFTSEVSDLNIDCFLQNKIGTSTRLLILKRFVLPTRRKMAEIEFENLAKLKEQVISDFRKKNKDVAKLKGTHAILPGHDANGVRFFLVVGFNELRMLS